MNHKGKQRLIPASLSDALPVIASALMIAGLVSGCSEPEVSAAAGSSTATHTPLPFTVKESPAALADFAGVTLTDHNKQTFSLLDYAGELVVMNFFFVSCNAVCPRQTDSLRHVAESDELPDDTRFVSVSFSPLTDTPQAMKAFAAKHNITTNKWQFAVSDQAGTDTLVSALGVNTGAMPGDAAAPGHRNTIFLFKRDGTLIQQYRGDPLDQDRLLKELKQLASL